MSRTFDILSNDTEFVLNNMGFQAYGTIGGDRAVLSRIMQIVTSHAWCLLTYMKFPVEQSLGVKLDSLADSQRPDGRGHAAALQFNCDHRGQTWQVSTVNEHITSEDFGPTPSHVLKPSASCRLKGYVERHRH